MMQNYLLNSLCLLKNDYSQPQLIETHQYFKLILNGKAYLSLSSSCSPAKFKQFKTNVPRGNPGPVSQKITISLLIDTAEIVLN